MSQNVTDLGFYHSVTNSLAHNTWAHWAGDGPPQPAVEAAPILPHFGIDFM